MSAQRLGLRKAFSILECQLKPLVPCTSHFWCNLHFKSTESVCSIYTSSLCIMRLPSLSNVTRGGKKGTGLGVNNALKVEESIIYEKRKKQLQGLLCSTFDLSKDGAKQIVESHSLQCYDSSKTSVSLLSRFGLNKATLIRYTWLVTISPEDLKAKLEILERTYQEFGYINTSAALFKLPNDKLLKLTRTWKEEAAGSEFPSKFHFLSTKLEISLADVMYMVDLRPFLLTISYKNLKERISLCIEAGTQKDELIKDFNAITASTAKLKERIKVLQQRNIPCKPWLLYTPQLAFEKYIEDYQKMRADMEDHANVESFLAARLKCDVSQVQKMIAKHAAVKKVSVAKLKVILDYLLIEKGIEPKMIIMRPEIFRHKLETVKERIERLEALGVNFLSLWIISSRDQVFEDYVKRWGCNENSREAELSVK